MGFFCKYLILSLMISFVVLNSNVAEAAEEAPAKKYINLPRFTQCEGPDCPRKPPMLANEYRRGCHKSQRCRH
ncbi:hypothetical protein C5167_031855 [Papaver somniferum]|uniref:Uncharacterized protein n=1 Tax=Papaver somniferum TaxID=3469 RepID=A0A4Y7K6T8_PAPSO|nr:hypothetical protein C5167_031855 [Papaver somniferum]